MCTICGRTRRRPRVVGVRRDILHKMYCCCDASEEAGYERAVVQADDDVALSLVVKLVIPDIQSANIPPFSATYAGSQSSGSYKGLPFIAMRDRVME